MLRFVVDISVKEAEYGSITDSVTEPVGEWYPLTMLVELADSGGEVFLTENVWVSPKMLRGNPGVEELEDMFDIYPTRSTETVRTGEQIV